MTTIGCAPPDTPLAIPVTDADRVAYDGGDQHGTDEDE
jgi:hypothetical protein